MIDDKDRVFQIAKALSIVSKKCLTSDRRAARLVFSIWGRRNLKKVLQNMMYRLRNKARLYLLRWARRSRAPAVNASLRLKGFALLALTKFRKRPFTLKKAWRWWSMDWQDLMRKCAYNLAYETSINEQIAFWRWKRLLIRKKVAPQIIHIKKAAAVAILVMVLDGVNTKNKTIAVQRIIRNGDTNAKRNLVAMKFVAGQIGPIRDAFNKMKSHAHGPIYYAQVEMFTNAMKGLQRPVQNAFNKMRTWDPSLGRRALKTMLEGLRKHPRGLLRDWGMKARKIGEIEAKKGKMLRVLSFYSDLKPRLYFMLWKNKYHDERVKKALNQANDNDKQGKLALGASLERILLRIQRPNLRLAFRRILEPNRKRIIRAALVDLAANQTKATEAAFYRWKVAALRKKKDEQLEKQPKFIEGVGKLDEIQRRKPKAALQSAAKNAAHSRKVDDALKKLYLIYKNGVRLSLSHWKFVAGIVGKTNDANKCLLLPSLLRLRKSLILRRLRLGLEAVRSYSKRPDMLRKLMVVIGGNLKDKRLRAFFLWNFQTQNAANTELEYKRALLFKLHRVRAGFGLLDLIQQKQPRDVFRTLRKTNGHTDKRENAISKIFYIHKNTLRIWFDRWLTATDLKTQKLHILRLAHTCNDLPAIARLTDVLVRKPCRFAFSKLQAKANPRTADLLRGALLVMVHSQSDALGKAMSIWKLNSLQGKMDDRITKLDTRSKAVEGFNKLNDLHRKHPRKALQSINKKKHHADKVDDTMKLLALINKKRLGNLLARWKSQAGLSQQQKYLTEDAETCMKLKSLQPLEFRLARPGLRVAFNAIKSKTPTKEKLRQMIILWDWQRGSEMSYFLTLWRIAALHIKYTSKISGLNKNPNIMAGFEKLNQASQRLARFSLRKLAKNVADSQKKSDSIKKLLFVSRSGLLRYFWDWKDKSNSISQNKYIQNQADMCFKFPTLNKLEEKLSRKPLRTAFNRIRANPIPEKLGKALRNLKNSLGHNLATAFELWKLDSLVKGKDKEIDKIDKQKRLLAGLNILDRLFRRIPRRALATLAKNKAL